MFQVAPKSGNCECQVAQPEQTCPTKILTQSPTPEKLFHLIIGDNSANHTFKVVLEKKGSKELFEREVTIACHGFGLAVDESGKPVIEEIRGVPMTTLKPNQYEPQFSRQSIQLKSVIKAVNALFFGGQSVDRELVGGKPVCTVDASLNIVINRELATAEELAQAKPILDFLKAQPRG